MATDTSRYLQAERRLWEHVGVEPVDRRITLRSGGEVRVQEVGDGAPFVLIHGGVISGTSWCHLAAALGGVRCILVDRPGCGLSDAIVGGPLRDLDEVKAYADSLLGDLLDALGLDEAAVGCTSLGGFYAVRGAASCPDRVTKLVGYSWLVGLAADGAPLTVRIAALPGMQELMYRAPMPRSIVKRSLKQFGLGKAIESGAFDDVMLDWVHALLAETDTMKNDGRSSPQLFTPIEGQNDAALFTDQLLSQLTMPVLLLWGSDDPNSGEGSARRFARRLPDAELVIIPGAEHAPWIDDLELCATRTREFLLQPA